MNNNTDTKMYARIIAFAIVQIIWILSLFGIKVPVIDENQLTQAIYAILDVVFMGYMIWKNHNFTLAAKEAQAYLNEHKSYKTDVMNELERAGVEIKDEDKIEGIGAGYEPLLKAPSTSDKHWLHTSCGGYNPCIKISGCSVLPNCVGYAYGRRYQLQGKDPKLSTGNAVRWWTYKDGYERGQTPKLGAVIVWKGGEYGHVGVVEKIDGNSITVSQSAYGGKRFYLTTLKKPYGFGKYECLGFIYLPETKPKETAKPKETTKEVSHKATYKVVDKAGVNMRKTHSTSGAKITAVPYGKTVKTTKKYGDWVYATYNKKTGWMCIKTGKDVLLKKV